MRKKIFIVVLLFVVLAFFFQFGKRFAGLSADYRLRDVSNAVVESACGPVAEEMAESVIAAGTAANSGDGDVNRTFCVISSTPEETVIEFTLPEYTIEDVTDEKGRTWQLIDTADADNLNWRGLPAVPSYRLEYGCIPGEIVEALLVNGEYRILENTVPVPAVGPIVQGQETLAETHPSSAVYGAGAVFPPKTLEVASNTYQIRGIQGQGVQVSPFQYDDATASVRTLTKGTIILKTKGATAAVRDAVSDFAQLQSRHFVNSDSFRNASTMEVGTFAIVLPDEWRENVLLNSYFDWKRKNGWKVLLGSYPSETGESSAEIREWISNAYTTEGISHLMLLGDYGVIPPYQHSSKRLPSEIVAGDHQFIASDSPYALLAGEDDFSYMDVIIGRVPVSSIAFAENYFQRMMDYERGEFSDVSWNSRGIYIGSSQSAKKWPYAPMKDYEHLLLKRQELEAVEIMSDGTEFFEKSLGQLLKKGEEVATAINDGAALAMYLGHGACPYYDTTQFSSYEAKNLENCGMLPFVIAPVCDTGNLDHATSYDYICSNKIGKSLGQSYFETLSSDAGISGALCASNLVSWNPPLALFDEITECLAASEGSGRIGSLGAYALAGIMSAVRFCDTYEADFKASTGEPNHYNGYYTKELGIYHAWVLEFLG
ncbi:MAG: C25 family cysteine peptidase, partial [Lentisphaeria bacterium]|nr:C25 family cysteine peptidase [Lentisphaeria bacterium]